MPGLKITWRGGIAYATGTIAGQRVRQSLGTRDKGQAAELCAQHEARLWKRHSYGEEAVRTFEEAALSYMEAGGESRFLAPLIVHFRGRRLGTIKPGEIVDAALALHPDPPADSKKPTPKPATRNRQVIGPARAVINHAADKGWCQPIRVTVFKTSRARRRAVDRSWIDAFLARADADGLPHLAAGVLFMYQTGARVSEAARVLPAHVDLGKREILLAQTKTDEWVPAYITDELVVRLANLAMMDGFPVFGYRNRWGIVRRMRAVCRRAGIPFVSPHQAGRHSFATEALARGATVRQVMDAGRWKSARLVLETYAHTEEAGRVVASLFDANLAQSKPAPAAKRGGSRKKRA